MDKTTAAEAIRRLAIQYQQMNDAADALESIGSLENAAKEAVAQRLQAEMERDKVRSDLKKAKDGIKDAEEKAAGILAEADSRADAIIAAADNHAAQSIADARAKVADMLATANKQASDIISNAGGQVDAKTAEIDALIARRNDLLAEIADAEDRAAKAQKQLDVMRGKLAAIVGE